MNKSATVLINAIVPALGSGNDTAYFWDLINPVQRLVLLNQTDIAATLAWNVTQQFEQNQTNLNWDTIPSNVQLFLQQEVTQNQLASLTFLSWGWTDSNNTFASTTLFSLFTTQGQQNLPTIRSIIAPLTFSTVLNTTVLTQGKRKMRPSKQVNNLFEDIQEALPFTPFPQPPSNRRPHRQRVPTPYGVIDAALNRAASFLWKSFGNKRDSHERI